MSSRTYDALKAVALIWLPALGTLAFAITDIWSIDGGPQIVGTIMAVDAFLGAVLGITSRSYSQQFDGHLIVDQTHPLTDKYSLDLTTALADLPEKNEVRLKVLQAPDIHNRI
jgi:Putative phage holin Dp-1